MCLLNRLKLTSAFPHNDLSRKTHFSYIAKRLTSVPCVLYGVIFVYVCFVVPRFAGDTATLLEGQFSPLRHQAESRVLQHIQRLYRASATGLIDRFLAHRYTRIESATVAFLSDVGSTTWCSQSLPPSSRSPLNIYTTVPYCRPSCRVLTICEYLRTGS